MSELVTSENKSTAGMAQVVYILYLASLVLGITSLVGVVIAYVNKSEAPEWLASHYRFQIRTFWIGFLYAFIGVLLLIVAVGWFILLFTLVWMIVRCVKGLQYLSKQQAHPNPGSWMF